MRLIECTKFLGHGRITIFLIFLQVWSSDKFWKPNILTSPSFLLRIKTMWMFMMLFMASLTLLLNKNIETDQSTFTHARFKNLMSFLGLNLRPANLEKRLGWTNLELFYDWCGSSKYIYMFTSSHHPATSLYMYMYLQDFVPLMQIRLITTSVIIKSIFVQIFMWPLTRVYFQWRV